MGLLINPFKVVLVLLVFLVLHVTAIDRKLRFDGKFTNEHKQNLTNDGSLPREYPCPSIASILPCTCGYDIVEEEELLYLDCSHATSAEALADVFYQDFPVTEFYLFRMSSSNLIKNLDFHTNGITFKVFFLSNMIRLTSVSENFFGNSSERVEDIYIYMSRRLTTFPFTSVMEYENLKYIGIDFSNITSIPPLKSDSLEALGLSWPRDGYDIVPGTLDGLTNLSELYLYGNPFVELKALTIPIFGTTEYIDLSEDQIENIEPNTFHFIGDLPALNSIELSLNNNKLHKIEEEVFGDLMPYIGVLSLIDNPLDCGCDMAWIVTNPEYLGKIDPYTYCVDGTPVSDLDPEYFEEFC